MKKEIYKFAITTLGGSDLFETVYIIYFCKYKKGHLKDVL